MNKINKYIEHLVVLLLMRQVEVVLQTVTEGEEEESKVEHWSARTSVVFSVLGEWGLGRHLVGSASWELGVEGNNVLHSLGSRVRAEVLYFVLVLVFSGSRMVKGPGYGGKAWDSAYSVL